jgi:hypothetical protein
VEISVHGCLIAEIAVQQFLVNQLNYGTAESLPVHEAADPLLKEKVWPAKLFYIHLVTAFSCVQLSGGSDTNIAAEE